MLTNSGCEVFFSFCFYVFKMTYITSRVITDMALMHDWYGQVIFKCVLLSVIEFHYYFSSNVNFEAYVVDVIDM